MNESKNEIINHFEKFIKVSDSLRIELLNRVSLASFQKNDLIIDASVVNAKSFYI